MIALFVAILVPLSQNAKGAIQYVDGGTLTLNIDGDAFANGVDAAYIDFFLTSFGLPTLTPGQTFMEFGHHFTPSDVAGHSITDFRPEPNPPVSNFSDLRAGWSRPASNNLLYGVTSRAPIGPQPLGRGAAATTFAFDPSNIPGSSSGLIGTTGATSFWYSNDALINSGSVWLAFGDLTLQFDSQRAVGGNSGWYFTNHLLFPFVTFDTQNVTTNSSGGILTIDGDLIISQEFHDGFGPLQGLNVGNFELSATTVPEPSTLVIFAGVFSITGIAARVRRRA